MTQSELNRAVAKITGESVSTISGMGFVPLMAVPYEREPKTVNWDEADATRNVWLQVRRRRAIAPVVV